MAIVLHFLQSVLDAGRCASTLKVYVAAISAGHTRLNNQTVGLHYLVGQFLKGTQRRRPFKGHCSAVMGLDVGFEVSVSAPVRTHGGGRTQVVVCKDCISAGNHIGEASG